MNDAADSVLAGVIIIVGIGAVYGSKLYNNMGINIVFILRSASAIGATVANCVVMLCE